MTFPCLSCRPYLEQALSVINNCEICLNLSVDESVLNRFKTKFRASNICDINHAHEVEYVNINRGNINSHISSPLCDPFFKKIIKRKCYAKYVCSCMFTFWDARHRQMV